MPDREKVAKAIEYLNWYFTQDDGAADKNAVEAWEVLTREREPVPFDEIGYQPVCGVCNETLDVTDEYCRCCGRKVRWKR